MKNGGTLMIIKKRQLLLATLILALGAAVFVNYPKKHTFVLTSYGYYAII